MKDYIEREAAIKSVYERCSGEHWEDILRSLPTADVRPVVKGEWIEHFEHYDTGEEQGEAQYGYVCSVCGRWEYEKEPFCNCGADMRGDDK